MENLALTTLIIIILAFPGYIFRASYNSGKFTRYLLPAQWTDDVVKAVLYSAPFHLLGLALFEVLQHSGQIHHTLNFEIVFRLLAGEFEPASDNPDSHVSTIVRKVYFNGPYLLAYYGIIIVAALLSGHILRKLVWELELDVKWSWLLRYRSEWLYELLGRGKLYIPHEEKLYRLLGISACCSVPHRKTIVVLDALTDQPTKKTGKMQLYSGIVSGFTVSETGDLQEIQLTKAKRGVFREKVGEPDDEFQLEEIPGRSFILKYSAVKNLNLVYLSADAVAAAVEAEPSESDGPT